MAQMAKFQFLIGRLLTLALPVTALIPQVFQFLIGRLLTRMTGGLNRGISQPQGGFNSLWVGY